MAHIETVQTGMRVITHVRGRIYRSQQMGPRAPKVRTILSTTKKLRRTVCLLSAKEAEWLQDFGISQPCFGPQCNHKHMTRSEVEKMVKAGDVRWIGESQNVAGWYDPKHLVVRRSMGMIGCVQLRAVGA
jgi:hypothetical protein